MHPFLCALYALRETTTLHVTFEKLVENPSQYEIMNLKGELRISVLELLKSIMSMNGNRRSFIWSFSLSLLRTYFLQRPRVVLNDSLLHSYLKSYPDSTLHEIKTGILISELVIF